MLNVTISDEAIKARLPLMSKQVHSNLKREIYRQAIDLQRYIIQEKLHAPGGYSATLLHRRTGNLARSIQQKVTDTPTSIEGKVYSDGSVDYAGIHEYGGTIQKFGRRVGEYNINMPKRSFMRTSLAENKEKIVEAMKAAVREGVKK